MGDFKDHKTKEVIRKQWCKPLLAHIYEKLGCKFTYLGLPGIEAIDILTWIDYLQKVIAIDIGDYSKPNNYNSYKAKKNIAILNKKLNELEEKGLIDNYSLYHGYIEEVVLKGMDKNGISFNLSDIVTIYNLDFCNSLTVPLEIVDPFTGGVKKYYKIEVFKKLLDFQKELSNRNNNTKFIFYLTIHSQFWEDEARKLFSGKNYSFYNKYKATISNLDEHNKNVRLLRLYIISLLREQFVLRNFIPDFLPTLYYKGKGKNILLCFTVIGTFINSPTNNIQINQNIETLINEKFLQPNEEDIKYFIQDLVNENNCIINPIEAIKGLQSYKEEWIK